MNATVMTRMMGDSPLGGRRKTRARVSSTRSLLVAVDWVLAQAASHPGWRQEVMGGNWRGRAKATRGNGSLLPGGTRVDQAGEITPLFHG